MEFAKPELLWLFLVYVPLIIWYIKKHKNAESSVQISSLGAFDKMPVSYKVYLRHIMFVVKLAAIGGLIIILCRPQTHDSWESSKTEGTDIILAMDVSTSMLARDFDPDRFEAAKDVASQFVSGRESDNIGIVIFAGESFTLVPMTTDKAVLVNYIKEIKMGMLQDGTAIGDGLATSINRIRNGKAKSKSIILLTDGSNNTGVVAPLTAADIAKAYYAESFAPEFEEHPVHIGEQSAAGIFARLHKVIKIPAFPDKGKYHHECHLHYGVGGIPDRITDRDTL